MASPITLTVTVRPTMRARALMHLAYLAARVRWYGTSFRLLAAAFRRWQIRIGRGEWHPMECGIVMG